MSVKYLHHAGLHIEAARRTETPRWGTTRLGYTKRSGAPTSLMIRLSGETVWRRLMAWQFSNCGTLFVRYKGEDLIVSQWQIPEPTE